MYNTDVSEVFAGDFSAVVDSFDLKDRAVASRKQMKFPDKAGSMAADAALQMSMAWIGFQLWMLRLWGTSLGQSDEHSPLDTSLHLKLS